MSVTLAIRAEVDDPFPRTLEAALGQGFDHVVQLNAHMLGHLTGRRFDGRNHVLTIDPDKIAEWLGRRMLPETGFVYGDVEHQYYKPAIAGELDSTGMRNAADLYVEAIDVIRDATRTDLHESIIHVGMFNLPPFLAGRDAQMREWDEPTRRQDFISTGLYDNRNKPNTDRGHAAALDLLEQKVKRHAAILDGRPHVVFVQPVERSWGDGHRKVSRLLQTESEWLRFADHCRLAAQYSTHLCLWLHKGLLEQTGESAETIDEYMAEWVLRLASWHEQGVLDRPLGVDVEAEGSR